MSPNTTPIAATVSVRGVVEPRSLTAFLLPRRAPDSPLRERGGRRDDPERDRARDGAGARVDAQLAGDARDVRLDRARRDDEPLRDLAVRQPRGEQFQDLALARRQRLERRLRFRL